MNTERIKEVFSDEEFVKSLFELETPEEVQAALEEKEIEMTIEEIGQVRDLLIRYQEGEFTEEELKALELVQNNEDGELSDEELENVAGGELIIGVLVVCGILLAVAVGINVAERSTRGRW